MSISRTWALRGSAGVVLAMVVGAWGLGIARGGDAPPPDEASVPAAPDTSLAPEGEVAGIQERRAKPRPGRAGTDPSSEAPAAPGTEEAAAPGPDGSDGSDDPEDRDPRTDGPTRTTSPSPPGRPSPSPTPSPSDGCTDLSSSVDCVLAPVTSRP